MRPVAATVGAGLSKAGDVLDRGVRQATRAAGDALNGSRSRRGDVVKGLIDQSPLKGTPLGQGLKRAVDFQTRVENLTTDVARGAANGLAGNVTGLLGLTGGALQLQDERVRAEAAKQVKAIANAAVSDPVGVLKGLGQQSVAAFTKDPGAFIGEVGANLIPLGMVTGAPSKGAALGRAVRGAGAAADDLAVAAKGASSVRRAADVASAATGPITQRGPLAARARQALTGPLDFPAAHAATQTRLAKQATSQRFQISVAHPENQFPDEFAGRHTGTPITALGDGDWYHGWNSMEYRLNRMTDTQGKTRSLFDPKYLKDGVVDLEAVKAAGRDPAKIGNVLGSLDDVPPDTRALVLSPNRFHTAQIEQLARNPNVKGIYVEKPMGINLTDLKKLDSVVASSGKAMYFGDHYVMASGAMTALMGKQMPFKNLVRITHDPTGKLASALQDGKSVLGEIRSIEGRTIYEGSDNLLTSRGWLQKASMGGGVMLDLQVHLNNVLSNLGFSAERIDDVVRMVRPDAPGTPRGVFEALKPGSDLAEDFARVQGSMTGGAKFDLTVAQFEKNPENVLKLTDKSGHSLAVDFETRKVAYRGPDGTLLGEAEMAGDPVMLTMDHALNYFDSGDTVPMFYQEQRKSIELIEAAKAHWAQNP